MKGFTLVELLVTITILAIVFGIVITSAAAVRRGSRDDQRQSDLRSIQSALEQYQADQTYYPSALDLSSVSQIDNTDGVDPSNKPPSLRVYLNKVPTDPVPGNPQYKFSSSTLASASCDNNSSVSSPSMCNKYCLFAKLETLSANNFSPACSTPPSGGYNFSVSSP